MQETREKTTDEPRDPTALRTWALIGAMALALLAVYLPLFRWLGYEVLGARQLGNGALLLVLVLLATIQSARGRLVPRPNLGNHGIGLLVAGGLLLWCAARLPRLGLLFLLPSCACSFAALLSFAYGPRGARVFLPLLAAFVMFGVLAGLLPGLDWPLRGYAARHAAAWLQRLGVQVELLLSGGQVPRLILHTQGRAFDVASECNGFGLLVSSLMLATVLAFRRPMDALQRGLLLVGAVPLALLFNTLRIVAICVAAPRTTLPYAWVHEILGNVFYLGGLACVWGWSRLAAPSPGGGRKPSSPCQGQT